MRQRLTVIQRWIKISLHKRTLYSKWGKLYISKKLQDILYNDKSKEVKRAIGVERTERWYKWYHSILKTPYFLDGFMQSIFYCIILYSMSTM